MMVIVNLCRQMMELNLNAKDAGDWIYRGEGAANIILSYSGSTSDFVCFMFMLYIYASANRWLL